MHNSRLDYCIKEKMQCKTAFFCTTYNKKDVLSVVTSTKNGRFSVRKELSVQPFCKIRLWKFHKSGAYFYALRQFRDRLTEARNHFGPENRFPARPPFITTKMLLNMHELIVLFIAFFKLFFICTLG